MPPPIADSADSKNKFEDLSGIDISAFSNPYDALIETCKNNPNEIQARYSTHRTTRNDQQKAKLLSNDFSGLIMDPILQKITDHTIEPGFFDPRNCLVFWARPPTHIRELVDEIQQKLRVQAPHLWLMPILKLHLTAFEVIHSLPTLDHVRSIVNQMGPKVIEQMTDLTFDFRSRLIKPMLSYDAAAIALSFLPAAGEPLLTPGLDRTSSDDSFTYHHLRQRLFAMGKATGISIESRYVVPSSHITIGRFLTQEDHDSKEKMIDWMATIEEINAWLKEEYWPKDIESWKPHGNSMQRGEWIVGQEKGIDCRQGQLWYGDGETIKLGKGF